MVYQDAVDPNNLPEDRYESEGESKNGWKTENRSKTGTVNTTTVQDGRAELAPVVEQDFRPVERNVDSQIPAYLAALGMGSKPLVSPEEQQRQAARAMTLRALGKGAEAIAHSFGANEGGASGYVNKDSRDPLYISSFNNYSNVLPNFNKAVASQNAELIKAQKELEKMGLNATMRYDINDQNKATIVGRNNTKYHNDAYKQWAHDNADKVGSKDTTYNVHNNSNTSYGSNTNRAMGVRQVPRGNGNGTNDNKLLPTRTRELISKDGTRVPSAVYTMKTGDFKRMLANIFTLAHTNVDNKAEWGNLEGVSSDRATRAAQIYQAQQLENKLETEYYNKHGKKGSKNFTDWLAAASGKKDANGNNTDNNYADLDQDQLEFLWHTMSPSLMTNYSLLDPILSDYNNMIMYDEQNPNGINYNSWAPSRSLARQGYTRVPKK